MRDTIIIVPKKSVINDDLPFVRTIMSNRDFVSTSTDPNVNYIIKIDNGVTPTAEQLSLLRYTADDNSVSVLINDKKDSFMSLRKFIYSFAGIKEPNSVGMIIFSVKFEKLMSMASDCDTIRILSTAYAEKYNIKKASAGYSDNLKFSLGSIKSLFSVFLSSKILKYVFSSVIAFIIDYILLLLLNKYLPIASLEIGAFIAWCVSSFVNFTVNRKFVFNSTVPLGKSLIEYYSLAGGVFVVKTYVFIEIMTRILSIPLAIAKPCAEVILFVINYFIQKKLIFNKKKKKSNQTK